MILAFPIGTRYYLLPTPIMKQVKNQILGTIAFFLLFVGLTNAAQSFDPMSQQSDTRQEIKEFSQFCSNGADPR